jgi:PleD family two-component response regulator
VASIYRPRTALIWFIFTFAILMIIGIGFVSGSLKLQVDFNNYMTNISSWASVWMLLVVIGVVAFRAMGVVQHTLLTLLQEVEEQRDQISHLANHDQLTGLPTMRLAQDRLEMAIHHAERNNEKVAVL